MVLSVFRFTTIPSYWENNGGYTSVTDTGSYWEGPNIKEYLYLTISSTDRQKADSMSTKEGITYSNNLVYSSDGSAEAVYEALANDAHAVYADPQFADVTDYTAGSWADGKTTLEPQKDSALQRHHRL